MIVSDQPQCFDASVIVAMSSRDDGTVLDRAMGIHNGTIVSNRTKFCDGIDIDYGNVVFQRIIYDEKASYSLLAEVDARSTTRFTSEVVGDALYTESKGVGLFLPVADCVATVVHDPKRGALALLHLGRHSTMTDLVEKTVNHFVSQSSNVADLIVWMSPSAQKISYAMDYFDQADHPDWQSFTEERDGKIYLDMQGYNRSAFIKHGVNADNIHISPIDTVTNPDYFSHSAGDTHGRQAVVAMLR